MIRYTTSVYSWNTHAPLWNAIGFRTPIQSLLYIFESDIVLFNKDLQIINFGVLLNPLYVVEFDCKCKFELTKFHMTDNNSRFKSEQYYESVLDFLIEQEDIKVII